MTAGATPRLSAVIPSLGEYGRLERVLDGYSRQRAKPGDFEVLVVVDASDPAPERVDDLLRSRPFPVRRLTGPVPGASANRNAGWRAASAPLVLFTDNDTIPRPRLVAEHLRWHERHPQDETGVLGRVRWAPELDVTTFMRWLDMGIQFDYGHLRSSKAHWGSFASANVSVKRSFMERVGGFDEERFPYGYEDTDWAYRASMHGFRLLYNRHAVVDHLRPMTVEFWRMRVRRIAVAEHAFIRRHPEMTPWFYERFTDALGKPVPRGRALRVARFVPPRLPWLGPRVWDRVDVGFRQLLAPEFLAAWEAAASSAHEARAQPDLSEFAEGTGTTPSAPSGPK